MTRYDAVIFDNDGVLVEPPASAVQDAAARLAFREVGVDDPDDAHVTALTSGVSLDALYEIAGAYGVDVDALWSAREHHDEQAQFAEFTDGDRDIYDDVTALSDLPVARGVVSNNHHTTVEFVLHHFDLDSLFDTYYGRAKRVETIDLKKPDTFYLDRAVADLGAEAALYVGDSESDVRAADRAGLDSVFVQRPGRDSPSEAVSPTYTVDSLRALPEIVAG